MSANILVSNLTQQCLDKFHEAMSGKNDTAHQYHLESRLAGFNLWVDNVGALAKSGASLDSRFRSRPDDLDLVKNILSLLSDFLDEYIDTIHKGLSIEESMVNIDSAIRNLAKIGVAIRRTGNASRSRRAYQSFNPDEHREFKQHLECLILLRPNEDQHHLSRLEISSINELKDSPSAESSEKNDISETKLEQLAKSKMEDLASSKLNEIQKRLVDANLRRRHNFLLAQKRSQRVKKAAQTEFTPDKHQPDIPFLRGTEISRKAILTSLQAEDWQTKPKATPTVTGHTIASTAEGTLQFNPAKIQQRAPTISPSQISFIAANTEFPRPPPSSQNQLVFKCPCCCQSLPSEDFTSPSRWRQHLIEDICPYTCIAQSCPTPYQLFTTRKAWELHVENDHPPQWQCLLCKEDDKPLSSEEDITTHTLTQHEQELSKYELSFLVSSAEVRYMGIESCPLCSSHGPRDSTELVDHAVRHAYEFALRALPWPPPVKEDLNKPIGTFFLPEDASDAEQLKIWLDSLQDSAEELSVSSFDKMDHSIPEKTDDTPTEDYFANNDYFENNESIGSSKRQTAQAQSSISWSKSSDLDLVDQNHIDDTKQAEVDLIAAVSQGDVDAVQSLIEDWQTFDSDGKLRKRALMTAVQGGDRTIVKQILGSGIDINSQDENGRTGLFVATERSDIFMARYLIRSGIDIITADHDGLTALHIAIQKGHKEIISMLFTPSVYQQFTDNNDQKASLWAGEQEQPEAAKILTELREKYEPILIRAQKAFKIKDRAAAARAIIKGNRWYALIDPFLEPLYFDLVDMLSHVGEVYSVAFSHDGKYLATGNDSGQVQIFDVETRQNVFQMGVRVNRPVRGICFSPDGRSLVTACGRLVQVHDIATKTVQYSFHSTELVYSLFASKNGHLLASAGYGGTVHIRDWEQGEEIKNFSGSQDAILSVKLSPDGRFVAAGGWDGYVYIWNLEPNAPGTTRLHHGSKVTSIVFSSDGKYLATGGSGPYLKVWDLGTSTCLSDFENLNSMVSAVSMTPDDRWIIAASDDQSIRFWDRTTGRSHRIFDAHKRRIQSMAVSPQGAYFVTASTDTYVHIWSYGPRQQT